MERNQHGQEANHAEVSQGFQGPHKHQEFGGPILYLYVYHPKQVCYGVNRSYTKPF